MVNKDNIFNEKINFTLLSMHLYTPDLHCHTFFRGEKKVICNKFSQTSSVTCLIWPLEGPIIVGLADGKVRAAIIKANKAQTLYTADAMTIALAAK